MSRQISSDIKRIRPRTSIRSGRFEENIVDNNRVFQESKILPDTVLLLVGLEYRFRIITHLFDFPKTVISGTTSAIYRFFFNPGADFKVGATFFGKPIGCGFGIFCAKIFKSNDRVALFSYCLPFFSQLPLNTFLTALIMSTGIKTVKLPQTLHSDPAGRIIIATAKAIRAPLVTKDEKILKYPQVKSIC